MTNRVAAFFDRDGVLNEPVVRHGKPYPPVSSQVLRLAPGARQALNRLRSAMPIFVVSNQPDVARGTQTVAAVEAINDELRRHLPITQVYVCYHDDRDGCDCRKPLPGLLKRAARDFVIDLARSYMVGDRWRDIEAGSAAGCATILIDRGYEERKPRVRPDLVVPTLVQAVDAIVRLENTRNAGGRGAIA